MPVTNFYTVSGEIIGEKTAGSPRVDYLTDALGSITATVNQNAQVVNTYRYKPFGATLAKTGTGPDPAFGWIGTQGYKPTQRKFTNFYVRARHDDSTTGRWTTPDPIGRRGGDNNLYSYVHNRPVIMTDESGLNPACIGLVICAGAVVVAALIGCRSDPKGFQHCIRCYCAKHPSVCLAVDVTCGALMFACLGVTLPLPVPVPVPAFALALDDMPPGWPKPGCGRRWRPRLVDGPCIAINDAQCENICISGRKCLGYICTRRYGCTCQDCPTEDC